MARFAETRWSMVLQAANESSGGRAALERLCRTYRRPVVAYLRTGGRSHEQSEDLAQAFFARFLEQEWYSRADPCRGRFRTFLLVALQRFVRDADRGSHALRRGRGVVFVPLDDVGDQVPAGGVSPEEEFDRAWARAVLEAALARLRAEAAQLDKLMLFDRLSGFLLERPDAAEYARAGAELHLQPGTIAVAVHRLRRRLWELVRAEVADTTAGGDDDTACEVRTLRATLHHAVSPVGDPVDRHATRQ